MNIGVDASCWTIKRGYGRYTRELLRALLTIDRENAYWLFLDAETARHSKDLPQAARHVIVETTRAATLAASADGRRSFRDLWAMRRAVYDRRRDLDLFYFPAEYTFFPLRGRPKTIITFHDATAERYPEFIFPNWRSRLFWALKIRWALRQADLMVTVSESARRDIIQAFRLSEERVSVVPDAPNSAFRPVSDEAHTRRVVAKYGIRNNDRVILYVGGLSPHKNLATLIEAYARLIRERGIKNTRLVLTGDFQGDVFYSCYPALRKQVETLGLGDDVIFTGFVADADLLYFYNAAQVLVMPSFNEGFGLPAVEAMACGTPVVASRAGALPEVVGEGGLFFDPRVPEELTNHLQALLENTSLQNALGRKGLSRAQQYSWDQSASAVLALFEKVALTP